MLVSALLGTIGSVSAMAQVYSLNTVGYISNSIPVGYSIITCPLVMSPDNTLLTLLPNTNGQYVVPGHYHLNVYGWTPGVGYQNSDTTVNPALGNGSGWQNGGTGIDLVPGTAAFIFNGFPVGSNVTYTWAGQVPSAAINYNMTNTLIPGFNLTGSILPAIGDIVSTNINGSNYTAAFTTPAKQDDIFTYDPVAQNFVTYVYSLALHEWLSNGVANDPIITNDAEGFFYFNNTNFTVATNLWVQSYTP